MRAEALGINFIPTAAGGGKLFLKNTEALPFQAFLEWHFQREATNAGLSETSGLVFGRFLFK